MAIQSRADKGRPTRAESSMVEMRATSKPVKVWATLGAIILAFQIYIWAKWISGPNFERVPVGPDQPPTSMKYTIWIGLCVGFVLAFLAVWRFVVRPWRRDGRLGLDGMMTLAFGLAYFQDPLFNYSGTWLTYNSFMPNWGSWLSEIPGSAAPAEPGAQLAESPLWVLPLFLLVLLPACIALNWLMRRCRLRWPTASATRLFLVAWLAASVFTLVLEAYVLMPIGFYTYAGADPGWSVNANQFTQYPIYEAILWGALWAAWASLRFFRNDRGETLAERGIEDLDATPRQQTGIRFLAVFGAISVMFLCIYNIPAQMFAARAHPFPTDVQERSYFLNGLCGTGTHHECEQLNRARPGR
ncbi:MAG: spirocyclase AveC family protein [Sporichthyaceae bacterium]